MSTGGFGQAAWSPCSNDSDLIDKNSEFKLLDKMEEHIKSHLTQISNITRLNLRSWIDVSPCNAFKYGTKIVQTN